MPCRGVERGFKGKCYPRLAKIVLSATLTQDPSKLSQLELHHPLLLNSGKKRYRIPTKLESYKLVSTSLPPSLCSTFYLRSTVLCRSSVKVPLETLCAYSYLFNDVIADLYIKLKATIPHCSSPRAAREQVLSFYLICRIKPQTKHVAGIF